MVTNTETASRIYHNVLYIKLLHYFCQPFLLIYISTYHINIFVGVYMSSRSRFERAVYFSLFSCIESHLHNSTSSVNDVKDPS